MEQTKYIKTTQHEMVQMIMDFDGDCHKLFDFMDKNNMWQYKKGLQLDLRNILNKLEINKIYTTGEIKGLVNDGSDIPVKGPLLNKRLTKLSKLGYMSRVRHGEWVRIK